MQHSNPSSGHNRRHNVVIGLLQALAEGGERVAVMESGEHGGSDASSSGGSAALLGSVLSRVKAGVRQFVGQSAEVTCEELLEMTVGLARHLRQQGLAPGDRVLVHAMGGQAFVASVAATLMLGGVPVLAEPRLGRTVYAACIAAAAPRWHLVHPLLVGLNKIPGAPEWLSRNREIDLPTLPAQNVVRVWITERGLHRWARDARSVRRARAPEQKLAARNKTGEADEATRTPDVQKTADNALLGAHVVDLIEPVAPKDDALLVFTGGTTANPRGVRLSHGALAAYLDQIGHAIEGLEFTRFLADTPQQVLYALRLGKTAVTVKGRAEKRARNVLAAVLQEDVDAYFGSPWIWVEMQRLLAENPDLPQQLPPSMQTVLLGGAPVTPSFLRGLRQRLATDTAIRCLYGMTEAGPVCAVSAIDKLGWQGGGDLVGGALGSARISIDAPEGSRVGEVLVHSPALFTGYLGEPPLGDAPFRTGDLGVLLRTGGNEERSNGVHETPNGNVPKPGLGSHPTSPGPECDQQENQQEVLVLMGRKKDMVIRRGVNLYPAMLESVVEAIEDADGELIVNHACFVGRWDPAAEDEQLLLALELRAPSPQNADGTISADLRKRISRALGTEAQPDRIVVLDRMPTTGRLNKVDRNAVRTVLTQ